MFEHNWASIPKIERVEVNGRRLYEVEDKAYPSITTVLSNTEDKSGFYAWRKRVGEEKANQISQAATRRGTEVHSMCEDYLKNELRESADPDAQFLFNYIKPHLEKVTEVKCLESGLYSHTLGVAGTVDCIAVYDGKLSVIDFKTSTKEKKAEYIESYFLQGCFYFWAYYEITKEMPEQIVILITTMEGSIQEFVIPKSDVIEWTNRLKDRIEAYHANNTATA